MRIGDVRVKKEPSLSVTAAQPTSSPYTWRGQLASLEATLARELKNQERFVFPGSNIEQLRVQISQVKAQIAALTGDPYGTSAGK